MSATQHIETILRAQAEINGIVAQVKSTDHYQEYIKPKQGSAGANDATSRPDVSVDTVAPEKIKEVNTKTLSSSPIVTVADAFSRGLYRPSNIKKTQDPLRIIQQRNNAQRTTQEKVLPLPTITTNTPEKQQSQRPTPNVRTALAEQTYGKGVNTMTGTKLKPQSSQVEEEDEGDDEKLLTNAQIARSANRLAGISSAISNVNKGDDEGEEDKEYTIETFLNDNELNTPTINLDSDGKFVTYGKGSEYRLFYPNAGGIVLQKKGRNGTITVIDRMTKVDQNIKGLEAPKKVQGGARKTRRASKHRRVTRRSTS